MAEIWEQQKRAMGTLGSVREPKMDSTRPGVNLGALLLNSVTHLKARREGNEKFCPCSVVSAGAARLVVTPVSKPLLCFSQEC